MLSDDQRRFFRLNGYLPVGQVSIPADVSALKQEFARLLGALSNEDGLPEDHQMRSADGHVRVALHLCHISEVFRYHALNAHVAGMLRGLFDEEPLILTSLLFNKPPQVGEPLDLHQDLPYYPYLRDDDLATCWMALDDVDATNGCLEYLPGSHCSVAPHRDTGRQQALDIDPSQVDTTRLVAVTLAAGEAVIHHGLTIHRSSANRSLRPRAGVAVLYVRASARVAPDDFPYPLLRPSSPSSGGRGDTP